MYLKGQHLCRKRGGGGEGVGKDPQEQACVNAFAIFIFLSTVQFWDRSVCDKPKHQSSSQKVYLHLYSNFTMSISSS